LIEGICILIEYRQSGGWLLPQACSETCLSDIRWQNVPSVLIESLTPLDAAVA